MILCLTWLSQPAGEVRKGPVGVPVGLLIDESRDTRCLAGATEPASSAGPVDYLEYSAGKTIAEAIFPQKWPEMVDMFSCDVTGGGYGLYS